MSEKNRIFPQIPDDYWQEIEFGAEDPDDGDKGFICVKVPRHLLMDAFDLEDLSDESQLVYLGDFEKPLAFTVGYILRALKSKPLTRQALQVLTKHLNAAIKEMGNVSLEHDYRLTTDSLSEKDKPDDPDKMN